MSMLHSFVGGRRTACERRGNIAFQRTGLLELAMVFDAAFVPDGMITMA